MNKRKRKACNRLLTGVLAMAILFSGCGGVATSVLFRSRVGFIGENGKNNMKLSDEFKDWERQVSAPVAVVDEGIYLKRNGEVQQLSCGANDLERGSEIAAIYSATIKPTGAGVSNRTSWITNTRKSCMKSIRRGYPQNKRQKKKQMKRWA